MAKQRKRRTREPAKPAKRKTPPRRAIERTPETLARALVGAWCRGDAPALDVAKHLDARSRVALYRAVNRLVRSPRVRRDLTESEIAQLVVRAIELRLLVLGGEGRLSAFADD